MRETGLVLVGVLLFGCGGGGGKPKPILAARQVPPSACADNLVDNDGGNLIVRGSWCGKPVRVLVDTGANGGSIAAELVDAAALPAVGNVKYASATGVFVDTTLHDAGELAVGGATIEASQFFRTSTHGGQYDVAIGLDQLAAHALVLDLGRRSFCLAASPDPRATQPMRVAGTSENRDIVVAARFGDVELANMILDTGAGVTTVNDDLLARLAHTELPEKAQAIDGTGRAVELPLVSVPRMCVHDRCVTDHMVMPSPDLTPLVGHPVDGIVGLPFFAAHVLVLDFPANKIGIDATGSAL